MNKRLKVLEITSNSSVNEMSTKKQLNHAMVARTLVGHATMAVQTRWYRVAPTVAKLRHVHHCPLERRHQGAG